MTVVEYDGRIVVVDTGLMFPTPEQLGIDLVLPDFTYLRERAEDIEAIVLTHGHEDHVGALPWILRELGPEIRPPIYGGRADGRDGALEDRGAQAQERAVRGGGRRRARRGRAVRPGADPRLALDPRRVRRRADVRAGHDDRDGRLQVRPDAGGRPPDRRRTPRGAGQRGSAAAVRRLDQRRPPRDGAVGGERRAGAEGGHRARGGSRRGDVVRVQRPPPPAGDRCRRRARPARRGDRPLDAQEPQHRPAARPRARCPRACWCHPRRSRASPTSGS